jgi:digeranylgeranylglycerophospholipid reductase
MESFDIAIIGAGPAGTYAAYTCADKVNTVVFEEHEKIGEPVHCGECLSSLAVKRMGFELPEEAISKKVEGIRLIWPNRSYSFIREEGFTLEKEKFEQFIGKLAEERGASFKLKHRVASIQKENSGWKISTTKGDYFAKIIIDASGSAAFCSKFLKLNEPPKTVVGLQYELAPIEHDDFIDFFLWPSLAPHGYLWIIPKKHQRANVGLVTSDSPNTRNYLEKFLDEYGLRQKNQVGKKAFGGLIPSSGPFKNTYSDSLLLVGDAAGFTSPMFEGGTSLALTSGKFAALVAVNAIRKNNTSREALSEYEKLWRNEFPDYSSLVEGKNAVYSFSESELSTIGSIIPKDLTYVSAVQKLIVGLKLLFYPDLFPKGFIKAMEALGKSRAKYYGW